MFADNKDFYPTPLELCKKLCAPFVKNHHGETYIAIGDKIVLEP